MDTQVRTQLVRLVDRFGPELGRNPRKCRAILMDVCPLARKEIAALVAASEEGIPAELHLIRKGTPTSITLGRLTQKLENDRALARYAAQWAVESWALALKVVTEAELPETKANTLASITLAPVTSPSAPLKSTVRSAPPTLIVDPMHRGHCATISEAIEKAQSGSQILVKPGSYRESLVIDKPVEIIGDGKRDAIVVRATEQSVIRFQTTRGRVANLTLRQMSEGKHWCGVIRGLSRGVWIRTQRQMSEGKHWCGVDITQGQLDLEGCDISSQGLGCILIHDGAYPTVRNNCIHKGKGVGIYIYDNGKGVIERNEIFGNSGAGIGIASGADPTVRNNFIHEGKDAGISVYDNGKGVIENNEIFENAGAGIKIASRADPMVCNNRIYRGKDSGIFVFDNGEGVIENNEIFGSSAFGISITTGARPTVRNNRIYDNSRAAICIFSKTTNVDYTELDQALRNRNWQDADLLTHKLMCQAANRSHEGWLDSDSIRKFPGEDLLLIDRLWVEHSDGTLGFSVQKRIWQECGSPGSTYSPNKFAWIQFGKRVNWQGSEGYGRYDGWRYYSELDMSDPQQYPGHLPRRVLFIWWGVGPWCVLWFCWLFSSLATRSEL